MTNKKVRTKLFNIHKIFDQKDGKFCVLEIDNKKKESVYYLKAGGQIKFVSKIILKGFIGFPTGLFLNRNGYGIKNGYYFFETLNSQINPNKPIELVITANGSQSIKEYQQKTKVVLPFGETRNFIAELNKLKRKHNDEDREVSASFLSTLFPNKIKISEKKFGLYRGGELAEILNKEDITKKLNEYDLKTFSEFFEKIFKAQIRGRKTIIKDYKIKFAKASRKLTEKIYITEVITEFEEKLKRATGGEEDWQKFLKTKVFPFLTGYVSIIDKENIGIAESYPDFTLIDVYGFLDIFEIKTHKTNLLVFDKSHENYYWGSDITEAISQLENYIDTLNKNSAEYITKINRKKDIEIKIIKPKGYIVAGTSNQFIGKDKKKMGEDFRRLSKSLKNIEFILYDELLENLKNIKSKLEK